jgi:hypothetical protein
VYYSVARSHSSSGCGASSASWNKALPPLLRRPCGLARPRASRSGCQHAISRAMRHSVELGLLAEEKNESSKVTHSPALSGSSVPATVRLLPSGALIANEDTSRPGAPMCALIIAFGQRRWILTPSEGKSWCPCFLSASVHSSCRRCSPSTSRKSPGLVPSAAQVFGNALHESSRSTPDQKTVAHGHSQRGLARACKHWGGMRIGTFMPSMLAMAHARQTPHR